MVYCFPNYVYCVRVLCCHHKQISIHQPLLPPYNIAFFLPLYIPNILYIITYLPNCYTYLVPLLSDARGVWWRWRYSPQPALLVNPPDPQPTQKQIRTHTLRTHQNSFAQISRPRPHTKRTTTNTTTTTTTTVFASHLPLVESLGIRQSSIYNQYICVHNVRSVPKQPSDIILESVCTFLSIVFCVGMQHQEKKTNM